MKKIFASLLIAIAPVFFAPAGFAADASVTVAPGGSLTFSPAVVNINTGDKVTWTWAFSGHTSTSGTGCSANGLWNSSGTSFAFTFTTAGNYPYFCSPHCAFGMTGEVVVAAVALPPTVTIISPTNGTILSAPANVAIQATATDSDGAVTNVEFRIGANTLTNDTATPFTAATNNLPAGSYALSAVATDSSGLKTTNSVNISVVTPVPLSVGSLQWLPPAGFQFSYAANIGLLYVVQRSGDLTSPDWTSLVTNMATNDPMPFTDLNAPAGTEFYRVGRLPNP